MKCKILLSPDPVEGGDPATPNPPSGPLPVSPQTAPPPAAATVLEGTRTERELQLQEENQRLAQEKKDREIRISELEDENHRLKAVPAQTNPTPPSDDEGRWRPFKV